MWYLIRAAVRNVRINKASCESNVKLIRNFAIQFLQLAYRTASSNTQWRIYNGTNGTSVPGLPLKMEFRGLPICDLNKRHKI